MAIPPGQEIFVAVTAEETYTTARAESSFTPEERNCYMEHERALRHADTTYYTLANCLLSREAQALVDRCGCVAFYMPDHLSRDFNLSAEFWEHCLPACDETKYSTELSSSLFPSQELIKNEAFSDIFKAIVTRMCVSLIGVTQQQSKECSLILAGKGAEELLANDSLTEPLYPLAVNYAR
ncbi:hypothetical protein FJT64_006326 [Amphibalanus amphitrite]|uniref:Uncharacterized protein n=1 Tax=Amphibalanus amphitrite TaxID=1232801 RepID=A0A6A4VNN2_AMPAM|nr:hypothetical protein FJT64_006326 [Amphibalanus amphitrite]